MAAHFSVLARKIPQTEEPGRLQSIAGCKESDTSKQHTHTHTHTHTYTQSVNENINHIVHGIGKTFNVTAITIQFNCPVVFQIYVLILCWTIRRHLVSMS